MLIEVTVNCTVDGSICIPYSCGWNLGRTRESLIQVDRRTFKVSFKPDSLFLQVDPPQQVEWMIYFVWEFELTVSMKIYQNKGIND